MLPYVKIRETDFNIKFPNGSEIIFMGLDEETKLLSLNDIGTIFIDDVPEDAWDNLNSSEFNSIMIGVKQVAEYLKATKSYATGRIDHLENAYNAWQKWRQENID